MTTLEDIQRFQQEGRSDDEIVGILQSRGVPTDDIASGLAQTRIKLAVAAPAVIEDSTPTSPAQSQVLQPSLITSQSEQNNPPLPPLADYPPEQAPPLPQEYSSKGQYYPDAYASAPAINADTISEIAEQTFFDKFGSLKTKIESLLDLKALLETKVSYIDERLKRLEKIIDRLQLSVLQKVGDYMTNVEDIKKELAETQQTFAAMVKKS